MNTDYMLNESQIVEKWAPIIKDTCNVTDESKLAWMSKYAHYHQLYESTMGYVHLQPNMNVNGMGAVVSPTATTYGSGDNFQSLLPLSMQVAAQTIAFDLLPVVPMNGPTGYLSYVDYVYSGGRARNIQDYRDGINNYMEDSATSPLMIKIALDNYSSDDSEGVVLTPNMVATLGSYEFTFIGRSRIDGKAIFRVKEATYHHDKYQGGEAANTPIYRVLVGGAELNFGDLTCTVANGATPELVKALEDQIPAYSGEGFKKNDMTNFNPYTREVGEATPANLMEMTQYTLRVDADTFKIAATATREQIQDMKQWGIDVMSQLEATLVNELSQSINKHILSKMFALGTQNAKEVLASEGESFSTVFTCITDHVGKVAGGMWLGNDTEGNTVSIDAEYSQCLGGEVLGTLQRRIYTKILSASNMIFQRGRRGQGTFAVMSAKMATAVQDCAGFMPYPLMNTIKQTGTLYPIGSIAGINIYVDPNMAWNDGRILVGRKGKQNEPGLVFMPYLMAESVRVVPEGTMGEKIMLTSRYALPAAGQNPQLQYYTMNIGFEGINPLG